VSDNDKLMSDAFRLSSKECPRHAEVWMNAVGGLAEARALDSKTRALAYLAVVAALRLESGVPFHVARAKEAVASREEVLSAILVGLPAAGHVVTLALPAAIQAMTEMPTNRAAIRTRRCSFGSSVCRGGAPVILES
jgi:alkylhydroperoxidase/carboxymuconolactone decarboxylase family protein YurZ